MNVIDEYIAGFPEEVQPILAHVRAIIQQAAPDAEECISWRMPTYKLKGNLIHFAGHQKHVGLYPGGEAVEVFKDELEGFKTSKGAIQLPYDKPLPVSLITKIVAYRVEINLK